MMNRRDFCKTTLGGVVMLGSLKPISLTANEFGHASNNTLSFTGLDNECSVFVNCFQQTRSQTKVIIPFDGSAEQIAEVRKELKRIDRDNNNPIYLTGLVGTHAYAVLETLFRDANAALLVRGQHVLRKNYEAHVFNTTPSSQGIAQVYKQVLGDQLPANAVTEITLGQSRNKKNEHPIESQKDGSRLQALARVYSNMITPEKDQKMIINWVVGKGKEQLLNHESFVFRI